MTPVFIAANVARLCVVTTIVTLYYAFFGHIYTGTAPKKRRVVVATVFNILASIVTKLFVSNQVLANIFVPAIGLTTAAILWESHLSGGRFWACFICCMLSELLAELINSYIYVQLFPDACILVHIADSEQYFVDPAFAPTIIVIDCITHSILLTIFLFARRMRRDASSISASAHIYQLRIGFMSLIILAILILSAYLFNRYTVNYLSLSANSIAPILASHVLPVLLLFTFFWQIIMQYRLYVDNKALEAKNRAYQSVLDGTREFRHNITNMIYGLEGVLMTEDIAAIRSYYGDMAKRCLLTNNENAVALSRVTDPVLTALLLRKLDAAAKMQLPVYVSADEDFSFNALPSPRLAEVLGVLLDNALEGAERSEGAQLNIVLRKTPAFNEILIANTFAKDADLSFLSGEAKSAKPGHQATGLASARRILHRYPEVCFNQYLQGRFIETSLCRYGE